MNDQEIKLLFKDMMNPYQITAHENKIIQKIKSEMRDYSLEQKRRIERQIESLLIQQARKRESK